MIKTLLVTAAVGGSGFAGWLGGSIWPAPPEWTDAIDRTATDVRTKFRLENVSFDGLREFLPSDRFSDIKTQIEDLAVATGEVIRVDREASTIEEQLDNLALDAASAMPGTLPAAPVPSPAPSATPSTTQAATPPAPVPTPPSAPPVTLVGGFPASLSLCERMAVSNAPAASPEGVVSAYRPVVMVREARIATFPTPGACLSSGYGPRNDRLHKGLDFHAPMGVPVLSGGAGQIVELKYREDYGNMILIDHGGGVFTRYAHLASFARGLSPGVTVQPGDQLGLMGNTANYQIPIHLHYELLIGDYNTPRGSFGLEPANFFAFPAAG